MMRLLLVAADRSMVQSFVEAASGAGVQPAGVDLTPFAIARAVSQSARGESGVAGAEAIVDVGAGITNIIVHHNGEPRFVRILLIGGDDTTSALASELDLSFEEAEALKLDISRGAANQEANEILRDRVDAVVGEIRGSLEYYSSQEDSEQISSVVVSGGGSLTPGFMERLESVAGSPVRSASPLGEMNVKKSGLTEEQVVQIEPVAAAAVGLAMGGTRS
jgi:type IV pilus assembly protein PilM